MDPSDDVVCSEMIVLAEPRLAVRGLKAGEAVSACDVMSAMASFGEILGLIRRSAGFFVGVDCGEAILADFRWAV